MDTDDQQIEKLLRKGSRIVGPKLTAEEHEAFMRKLGISKQEDKRWHQEHGDRPELTPAEHQVLVKRLGVSKEEDEKWHNSHGVPLPGKKAAGLGLKAVNPFAVGGGFLAYCVKRGWLVQEGKGRKASYCVTRAGVKALEGYGIKV